MFGLWRRKNFKDVMVSKSQNKIVRQKSGSAIQNTGNRIHLIGKDVIWLCVKCKHILGRFRHTNMKNEFLSACMFFAFLKNIKLSFI